MIDSFRKMGTSSSGKGSQWLLAIHFMAYYIEIDQQVPENRHSVDPCIPV